MIISDSLHHLHAIFAANNRTFMFQKV